MTPVAAYTVRRGRLCWRVERQRVVDGRPVSSRVSWHLSYGRALAAADRAARKDAA